MIRICTLLFALVLFVSCEDKNKLPDGILKPDKMQAVLWDVIRADAFSTEFLKNNSKKDPTEENLKLQQQILAIHKTTRADFYRSYDYYKSDNTQLFKKLLDSMVVQAERNRNTQVKPVTPVTPKNILAK